MSVRPRLVELTVYAREAVTPLSFLRLLRVRLSKSKVGWLVCPRPITVGVRLRSFGGRVWLRSHTTDISVLNEHLIGGWYGWVGAIDGTIVDLGANNGLTARWFLARHPRARVVCVEPDPGNLEILRRNLAEVPGRASLVPACVGSHERRVALVGTDGEWSFAMRETEGPGDADVRTMEHILDEQGVGRVALLKSNIEGAEREVFADCGAWIDRIDRTVVECHGFASDELLGWLGDGWTVTDRTQPHEGSQTITVVRAG
jgi:FkbM family methyltransferase